VKRHPLVGGLSILAAIPPLWLAIVLFLFWGVSLTDLLFLQWAVPAICALFAGLLLLLGHRHCYLAGIAAWALLVATSLYSLSISWWSYTPGSVLPIIALAVEGLYAGVGLGLIAFFVKQRRHASAPGGAIA
jgi:hypothetical protein